MEPAGKHRRLAQLQSARDMRWARGSLHGHVLGRLARMLLPLPHVESKQHSLMKKQCQSKVHLKSGCCQVSTTGASCEKITEARLRLPHMHGTKPWSWHWSPAKHLTNEAVRNHQQVSTAVSTFVLARHNHVTGMGNNPEKSASPCSNGVLRRYVRVAATPVTGSTP